MPHSPRRQSHFRHLLDGNGSRSTGIPFSLFSPGTVTEKWTIASLASLTVEDLASLSFAPDTQRAVISTAIRAYERTTGVPALH